MIVLTFCGSGLAGGRQPVADLLHGQKRPAFWAGLLAVGLWSWRGYTSCINANARRTAAGTRQLMLIKLAQMGWGWM